jgi:hypothetical protein
MAFGRSSQKQAQRIADRAVDVSEEAIAAAAEYLGLKKPLVRSSGQDALAFIGGLLFGGLAAATVAILLAPTDGQTFRARLTAQLDDLLGRTDDDADTASAPFGPSRDAVPAAAPPSAVSAPAGA